MLYFIRRGVPFFTFRNRFLPLKATLKVGGRMLKKQTNTTEIYKGGGFLGVAQLTSHVKRLLR